MSQDVKEDLKALVQASADEFFKTTEGLNEYTFSKEGAVEPPLAVTYAAVIGYSGEAMKGSLVITCEREFLDKSHPNHAMGMPVAEADIVDWIGEISNQLLGRIKNKLIASQLKLGMGTPTTVTGKSMQITPPRDGFVLPFEFSGPLKNVTLFFLAVVDANVKIQASKEAATTTAAEGDSFLF